MYIHGDSLCENVDHFCCFFLLLILFSCTTVNVTGVHLVDTATEEQKSMDVEDTAKKKNQGER